MTKRSADETASPHMDQEAFIDCLSRSPRRLRIYMSSIRSVLTSGWRICFCDGSKRHIVNLLQLHELVKGKHATLRVKVRPWSHGRL